MNLHELHQRRLEATVQLVEQGLDRMERLLNQGGERGIVQAVENTLSEEQRSVLLERICRVRDTLRGFAERFALRRQPLDIRQILNAELSSAWVVLENCRPQRMKGYGVEFEAEARAELEQNLDLLLVQVIALRAILR